MSPRASTGPSTLLRLASIATKKYGGPAGHTDTRETAFLAGLAVGLTMAPGYSPADLLAVAGTINDTVLQRRWHVEVVRQRIGLARAGKPTGEGAAP